MHSGNSRTDPVCDDGIERKDETFIRRRKHVRASGDIYEPDVRWGPLCRVI